MRPSFLPAESFEHRNKLVALAVATDAYHYVSSKGSVLVDIDAKLRQIQAESLRRAYRVASLRQSICLAKQVIAARGIPLNAWALNQSTH